MTGKKEIFSFTKPISVAGLNGFANRNYEDTEWLRIRYIRDRRNTEDTDMADSSVLGLHQEKYAGILVHPTSFPGPYGIGDLGPGAYAFVDFLERSGLNLWQVLPLGHTGFGDSPYQPFSSFAGQPYIISIDDLRKAKLLVDEDFYEMPQWEPCKIEYGKAIAFKTGLLKKAYERFMEGDVKDEYSTDE